MPACGGILGRKMPFLDGYQLCVSSSPSPVILSVRVIYGSLSFENGRFLSKIAETVDTSFDQILQGIG